MSVESRENFAGIVTNAAGVVAPNGSLIEAENVVIRRPGAIQPRDGLRPGDGMDGTEVWGLAHQRRDLVARYSSPTFRYYDLLGTEITYEGGVPPVPLRRDILTSAQARGNLYLPTTRGVVRLIEGSNAWEDAGLVMVGAVTGNALHQGPPPPETLLGVTGFGPTSLLQLPAGQGIVQSADYWTAVQFFLNRMPSAPEILVARFRGTGATLNGYQVYLDAAHQYIVTLVQNGVSYYVAVPMAPEDVGRIHVLYYTLNSGALSVYLDGVLRGTTPSPTITSDPADVMSVGNKASPAAPLQSATLLSVEGGQTHHLPADVLTIYNLTKAGNYLATSGIASNLWVFDTLPPRVVVGGQSFTQTGQGVTFQSVDKLYPGDPDPGPYPDEFWLPAGYHAGYRLVGVDRDPNGGLERRSAPSDVFEVINPANSSGAAAYVTINVRTLRPGGATYDETEVYRTRAWPLDVRLDDEMQLVGTLPTPPGSGVVDFVDKVADGARGAVLYTSPSRGGILQQNDPPPACACVAFFKGSLFFANTRGPARLIISYNAAGNATGQATGIGVRLYNGSPVSGSTTLAVSSTVGLEPGQVVIGLGMATMPPYSVVESVDPGAGTVVLSQPALATGTGLFQFEDVIWFGDHAYSPGDGLSALDITFPPDITATKISPPLAGYEQTWALTSDSREPAAWTPFEARATHGGEYSPAIPLYNQPAKPWDQDVWPGGLMWSKTDEPEHVPPINYAFVGDHKGKATLGLVPTRDALFILKEDGVFRLTGANAVWRIDPYDPTLFCCMPNSVYPLQEQAYFLSNKGVIAFSDAGSEIVSLPVNDAVKAVVDKVYAEFRVSGFYEYVGVVGSVAAVYERENEYTLMLGRGLLAMVYNRSTKAWTSFRHYADASEAYELCGVFNASNAGRVVYVHRNPSLAAVRHARWTMLSTDTPVTGLADDIDPQILPPGPTARYDIATSIALTASGTPAAPIISFTPVRAVLRDDVISDVSGRFWRVTQTSLTGTVGVAPQPNPAGGHHSPTSGAGHLFRSLRCKVTPQDFVTPPPRPKRWRALSTAFVRLAGPVVLRYAYSSAESPRAPDAWDEEEADTVKALGIIDYPQGYAYAGLVPSAHARSWAISGSIRWAMTHGVVRLEGVYVEAEAGQIGRQQKAL